MLKRFLDYNLWADQRFVENIRAVPPDVLAAVPLAPFGSVLEALRHLAGAGSIWLERMRGVSPTDFMGRTDGMSTEALLDLLVATSQAWVRFAEEDPAALGATITYAKTRGEPFTQQASDIVLHVVNHATYHRGQVMSALRSVHAGRLAGLDMILYTRKN